jgi:1,4-alpha-glucan branching enzyme
LSTFWSRESKIRTKALYSEGKLVLANSWDAEGNEKDPLMEFYYEGKEAKSVLIVGEFTNWEENPIRMDKVDDILWFKRVILPKGQYQYRFKVDNEWASDPLSKTKIEDEFGNENCVAVFSSIEETPQGGLKKNIAQKEDDLPKNPEWFAASI